MITTLERIVRDLLLRNQRVTAGDLAGRLKVSRQAAHRHLKKLVEQGKLVAEGAGRGARYVAPTNNRFHFRYRTLALAEDRVATSVEQQIPRIGALPNETRAAFFYTVTEMLNNAIDHSRAKTLDLVVELQKAEVAFEVIDAGVGAFESVRSKFQLGSILEAIQELSKGKITTMPERHTGEGVFFTSKVASRFEMEANGLLWIIDNRANDTAVLAAKRRRGTRVRVELPHDLPRTLGQIFDEYSLDDEFAKTRTLIRLFAIGTRLVSRSEARRLMHGLERFREVILDFKGIDGIGQGFVDEVFRVWSNDHPEVRLAPVNMNDAVQFMVTRGLPQFARK